MSTDTICDNPGMQVMLRSGDRCPSSSSKGGIVVEAYVGSQTKTIGSNPALTYIVIQFIIGIQYNTSYQCC